MSREERAGIAIDPWKVPIFERHLKQSGYAVENCGHLSPEIVLLKVPTTNLEALAVVIKAANDEAARTGAPA